MRYKIINSEELVGNLITMRNALFDCEEVPQLVEIGKTLEKILLKNIEDIKRIK